MKQTSESENLILEVTDLARGGAGVARDEGGRVVFIPRSAPGDRLRVRIVRAEKRYAQGEILEILTASPDRVTPACPVFGRCGGCEWQHLPYERQWATKVNGVKLSMERMKVPFTGKIEELPAERIWNYRNRVQLRGFGSQIGYYAPESHDLVPIESCPIAREEINAEIPRIREEGARLRKPYKVEIEVLADRVRTTWNSSHAAGGFRQVHDEQNEKLKSWVDSVVPSNVPLLDLFGGNGNLSLGLASRMTEVHCVDVSSPAGNPEGTPSRYHFHRSAVLPWVLKNRAAAPGGVAITDPPREGLSQDRGEIANALESRGITGWVLVGCDIDSWMHDIFDLTRGGWVLQRVGVLDLFPQTHHVEGLAFMTRRD